MGERMEKKNLWCSETRRHTMWRCIK